MLVLSRSKDECVRIGPDVTVTIVGVRENGAVRLGFTAPREVVIHRAEVAELLEKSDPEVMGRSISVIGDSNDDMSARYQWVVAQWINAKTETLMKRYNVSPEAAAVKARLDVSREIDKWTNS